MKRIAGLLACGACAVACAGPVRTVTAPAVTLDTRIGLLKEVEDTATLRLSTRWDDAGAGTLTVNGAEAARLGADAEADHVLDGLAPGEYVCQWTTGASTNLATFCVRGGASALPPDGAGVRTATAAAITLDTRIGLVKVVEGAAALRLSTRWDGAAAGVLTVNGAEAARLGSDAEADHVLGGLAPGEYVCQWTTGASTNLATFCVRGGASALPPDGAGVRTATASPVTLDTRIGLVKVVEDAATLRLSTRWDGVPEGVLTVNGAEAARLGADAEADHVLGGLAPGEYVCQWTTGASTNLATFCVRGGASALPPDGAGVRTATASPVTLDTRIGLVKVVEGAATLRLSTRWDGAPEGVLTVNGAEAARLGADAEADHVLDGLAPGEYVCSWTTGASTNLATFCVRGGASILPPDGAGVRTVAAAAITLDTRIGLVKVVEGAATLRLSTRWDGTEAGVLTVNGAEAARLGAAEEVDHTLDNLAPGEYVCSWTTGASTNLATFCVRGGASILPPDGVGVRTATAAPVALDTRIGLYKVLPVSDRGVASAVCRLSTRWDGAESGTLTVNGEEVRTLGAAEEADHRMDNLAPGEYVCRWTAGDAVYLATFSVRGDGSARPPRTGVEVTITGYTATYAYDGREKRAGGFVVTTSDPLYTADDFVFTGCSNAVRTAVGTTAFGMSASDFANVNPDFADVVFHVVDGSVTVTPGAVVNPFDPFDPSAPSAPGALARADCVTVYDGEGHTISVAPLLNPALAADGAAVTYSPDPSRVPFAPENPVFTNAVSTSVWYRVASPNYAPFTTNALLEIRPRPVTLTSGTKTDFVYDGQPHEFPVLGKSENGFVAGEGVTTSNWATVTAVAEGEVANTFDYTWYAGTRAENYALTVVTGRIAVIAAPIPVGPGGVVTAVGYTNVYDGAAHGVAVSANGLLTAPMVQYRTDEADVWADVSPTFGDVCDTQVWYRVSAPNYAPVVGSVGVRITPRPITLTSKSDTKVYDGTPLRCGAVRVKDGSPGFVDGEGFAATCSGALTDVGAMENLFDYALTGGAKADNYAVTKEYGWLRVTPATLDPGAVFGGGETDADGGPLCARVYNGAPQPFAPAPDFGEPYRLSYALVPGDESAYSETAPMRTHVAEGDLTVYFKFLSPNYAPYYGKGTLRIVPKALTEEMCVADEDAAWFFDGTEKRPAVTVVDGDPNIATADDYTLAYSGRTGAGLFPVTVTGTNDYCGVVTKEFAILKRPVAPPVIGDLSYNGKVRKPTIPQDPRWTVIANPGGIDAGSYTNIVLRLANPEDYRWKGQNADETDWVGSFTVRRAGNGWTIAPGIADWTEGEAPSEPKTGKPRNGTVTEILYRARGAAIETAATNCPTRAGLYTVRFSVAETKNYLGTFRDVDFEIRRADGGTATATTPVPVPYDWLVPYLAAFGGDYEAAAHATGANGVALWESYVAGLDPADAASRFTAKIALGADGRPVVTWSPDLRTADPPRAYTVYGKPTLGAAAWTPVTDANRAAMRFFRVEVEIR